MLGKTKDTTEVIAYEGRARIFPAMWGSAGLISLGDHHKDPLEGDLAEIILKRLGAPDEEANLYVRLTIEVLEDPTMANWPN